jgi:hypothetical protein
MVKFTIGDLEFDKTVLHSILSERRETEKYRVIDIGGFADGWASDISDLIVDINLCDSETTMQLNVCESLDKLLKYVEKHGKFDYCICSHVLEDLYNPYLLLDNFNKIAKAGVVMVPYFKSELSIVETKLWLGYLHHRYIFKQSNNSGNLVVIPKMPFLEKFSRYDVGDINFKIEWEGNLPYEVFMDYYLGPNINTVFDTFSYELGLGLSLSNVLS